MWRGIGRALFTRAEGPTRAAGADRCLIVADPGALPFYISRGAVRIEGAIEDVPSGTIPGQWLPRLVHASR